jgi:predicted transcriptional regulator
MKKKRAHGRPRAVADVTPVLADYKAGMLVKDIAVKYGIGRETVRNYARTAGLGRRENGEGTCGACQQTALLREGICNPCRADIPLTGGHWVPKGGIVVWEVAS